MDFMGTSEQLVGILPVVVVAGVAMKAVDWLGSKTQPVSQPTKKKGKNKDVYNRNYVGSFGDFSNVGL